MWLGLKEEFISRTTTTTTTTTKLKLKKSKKFINWIV